MLESRDLLAQGDLSDRRVDFGRVQSREHHDVRRVTW